MLKLWPALWTFAEYADVVPTNNDQERALRLPVRIRKNSYGSTSFKGAETIANLLSVLGTARRRGVSFIEWLKAAREAFLQQVDIPDLAPPVPG